MIIHPMSTALHASLAQHLNGVVHLPETGVIRVVGAEAAQFLHGQLTQDILLMGQHEARLAAFCSAKGRMLASFMVFKRGTEEVLLTCSRDILPQTVKRLSMFVLRAKAKVSDASDTLAVYGVAGAALQALMQQLNSTALKTDADAGDATLLLLAPAGSAPRGLWLAPADAPPPAGPALDAALWQWGSVHSGIAPITAPTVEAYVPQMLNYESVGGVHFQKGCYPGQEVVARSQFRGTLKRRAYIVHGAAAMAVGQEVFHAEDASQPCGTVALAAPSPLGGWDAIASLQTAAATGGTLHLGAADGPALELLPLPYPLRDDI